MDGATEPWRENFASHGNKLRDLSLFPSQHKWFEADQKMSSYCMQIIHARYVSFFSLSTCFISSTSISLLPHPSPLSHYYHLSDRWWVISTMSLLVGLCPTTIACFWRNRLPMEPKCYQSLFHHFPLVVKSDNAVTMCCWRCNHTLQYLHSSPELRFVSQVEKKVAFSLYDRCVHCTLSCLLQVFYLLIFSPVHGKLI